MRSIFCKLVGKIFTQIEILIFLLFYDLCERLLSDQPDFHLLGCSLVVFFSLVVEWNPVFEIFYSCFHSIHLSCSMERRSICINTNGLAATVAKAIEATDGKAKGEQAQNHREDDVPGSTNSGKKTFSIPPTTPSSSLHLRCNNAEKEKTGQKSCHPSPTHRGL